MGRLAATSVVGALLLAACGGGGGVDRPSGAKGAFIAQADPICAQMQKTIGADLGNKPLEERDAVQGGVERLKALALPGQDRELLDQFYAELANVGFSLDAVAQKREDKDEAGAKSALLSARQADERAADVATRYQFDDCSKGVTS